MKGWNKRGIPLFYKIYRISVKWWILPTKNYIVAGYRMYAHNNQGLGWSRIISMSEYDDANYNSI